MPENNEPARDPATDAFVDQVNAQARDNLDVVIAEVRATLTRGDSEIVTGWYANQLSKRHPVELAGMLAHAVVRLARTDQASP